MEKDIIRKKIIVDALLRKEQWELEAIKNDNARANKILLKEEQAAKDAEINFDRSLNELRYLVDDGVNLRLDVVAQVKSYVSTQHQKYRECEGRKEHIQIEVDKIAEQLRRKYYHAKVFQNVSDSVTQRINVETEKKSLLSREELWLLRLGNQK